MEFNKMEKLKHIEPLAIIKKTTEHYYALKDFLDHEPSGLNKLIPVTTITMKFFKDGRIRAIEYLYDGQSDYKTVYKYNRKKQLIKSLDCDQNNKPIRKAISKYDSKGLLVELCVYSDMKNIDFRHVISYDQNSLKKSETLIQSDGSSDGTSYFEYGKSGKEIICTYKDNDGNIIEKFIDLFDEAGNNVLTWVCKEENTVEREYVYSYDLHNNLVEKEVIIYSNGIVTEKSRCKFKYVYDTKNNWIKAYNYHESDEFSSVVVREIDYF